MSRIHIPASDESAARKVTSANARLIDAAPDLLVAAKMALRLTRHPTSAEAQVRAALVAAIAKAEGWS